MPTMKISKLKIRVELAKIGKNQTWLAKQLGYTRSYISYLIGKNDQRYLDEMAKAIGVDHKDLTE